MLKLQPVLLTFDRLIQKTGHPECVLVLIRAFKFLLKEGVFSYRCFFALSYCFVKEGIKKLFYFLQLVNILNSETKPYVR